MRTFLISLLFGLFICSFTSSSATAQTPNPYLYVQLYTEANHTAGNLPHDGVGIFFNDNYNNGFDNGDALKPMNFNENLGRNIQGTIVSIEQRKLPVPGEILELYTNGYTRIHYVLEFHVSNINSVNIYLDDAYTGTTTLVNHLNTYNFSVATTSNSPSRATDRFSIRFEPLPITYSYENAQWSPQDPNGIITSQDNIVIKNGVADLSSETYVNNIEVWGGATLNIWNTLHLSGNMTLSGDLIFKSTATTDGALAAVSATSVITGEVIVERYMQNRRSYRMVSSSVTTSTSIHDNWQEGAQSNTDNPSPNYGTHITGTKNDQENGFDATQSGNASMFKVDSNNQQFVPIANTNINTLNAGDAYLMFIRGDRSIDLTDNNSHSATTLRAKGILATGNITQNYSTQNSGDFIMFGNPYQSAVDMNIVFASSNLNPDYYYVYDASMGTHGAYVAISLPDGLNIMESSVNQFLQSGAAAQVSLMQTGTTNLEFTEMSKAPGNHNTSNFTGNQLKASDMMTIKLFTQQNFQNNGTVHDGIGFIFNNEYSNAVTSEDAIKPFNFYENLAINKAGSYLSIEKRQFPTNGEIFELYISGYTTDKYVLNVELLGLNLFDFYLYDSYLQTSTPITNNSLAYFFEIDFSDALSTDSNRFSIHTENFLGLNSHQLNDIQIYPNPWIGNSLTIKLPNPSGSAISVTIRNLLGQSIFSETYSSETIHISSNELFKTGIYFVTLQSENLLQTFKIIKE